MTQIRTRRGKSHRRGAVPHELFPNRREHRRSGAGEFVTLCRLGLGLGLGLGDPRVTPGSRMGHAWAAQASRMGHPWVDFVKYLCLQQKVKNAGWGKTRSGKANL